MGKRIAYVLIAAMLIAVTGWVSYRVGKAKGMKGEDAAIQGKIDTKTQAGLLPALQIASGDGSVSSMAATVTGVDVAAKKLNVEFDNSYRGGSLVDFVSQPDKVSISLRTGSGTKIRRATMKSVDEMNADLQSVTGTDSGSGNAIDPGMLSAYAYSDIGLGDLKAGDSIYFVSSQNPVSNNSIDADSITLLSQ